MSLPTKSSTVCVIALDYFLHSDTPPDTRNCGLNDVLPVSDFRDFLAADFERRFQGMSDESAAPTCYLSASGSKFSAPPRVRFFSGSNQCIPDFNTASKLLPSFPRRSRKRHLSCRLNSTKLRTIRAACATSPLECTKHLRRNSGRIKLELCDCTRRAPSVLELARFSDSGAPVKTSAPSDAASIGTRYFSKFYGADSS